MKKMAIYTDETDTLKLRSRLVGYLECIYRQISCKSQASLVDVQTLHCCPYPKCYQSLILSIILTLKQPSKQ